MSPDSPRGEVVAFGEAYRTSDLLRCRLSCSSPGYGHKCVKDINRGHSLESGAANGRGP